MLSSSGKVSPNGSASKIVEPKSTYQVFGTSALQSELKTIYKSQIEESVLDVNDTLQKASKEGLLSIIKSVRTALPASNSIIRKCLNNMFTNAVGSGSRLFQGGAVPLKLEPDATEVKLESRIKEESTVLETGIHSKYQKTLDELQVLESLLTGQIQALAAPFETPLLNSLQRFFEEQIAVRNAKVQQLEDKSIQDSKDMMALRRQTKDKEQQLTKLQADLQESQRLFLDVSRPTSSRSTPVFSENQ